MLAPVHCADPAGWRLEGAGYRVWWDGLIEGGERFSTITETALERAAAASNARLKPSSPEMQSLLADLGLDQGGASRRAYFRRDSPP